MHGRIGMFELELSYDISGEAYGVLMMVGTFVISFTET